MPAEEAPMRAGLWWAVDRRALLPEPAREWGLEQERPGLPGQEAGEAREWPSHHPDWRAKASAAVRQAFAVCAGRFLAHRETACGARRFVPASVGVQSG